MNKEIQNFQFIFTGQQYFIIYIARDMVRLALKAKLPFRKSFIRKGNECYS